MAAASPHAFVEQHLSTGVVDLADEPGVLLLAEVGLARMRPPQEPSYVHATPCEIGEHIAHGGPWPGKAFVGIAFPIGEVHPIASTQLDERAVEAAVVRGAVDQHF